MNIVLFSRHDDIYTQEYIEVLRSKGIEVFMVDVTNIKAIDYMRNITEDLAVLRRFIFLFKPLKVIVAVLLMTRYLWKKKLRFDVAQIMYYKYEYILLAPLIKRISPRLIISIYGSDYFLSKLRGLQRILYDAATYITFNNPSRAQDFNRSYAYRYADKIRFVYFGTRFVELIDHVMENDSLDRVKSEFGIAKDRKVVLLGTYASPLQQHVKLLNALAPFRLQLQKMNITFIIPLTYGGSKAYVRKVIDHSQKVLAGCDVRFITSFMTSEQAARLRIISDVVIQVMKSDSLSGASLQALYCGSIFITGSWLPYSLLDEKQIFYFTIKSVEETGACLMQVLEDFDQVKAKSLSNKVKVRDIISWKIVSDKWLELYT